MSGPNYTKNERASLAEAIRRGDEPHCPVCGAALSRREISPHPELPYVRRRIWLLCPSCRRSAVVDL